MKKTKQRDVILDVLRNAGAPLSASMIFERACVQLPKLAITTVYRNLEKMTEQNLLLRHRLNDTEYFYEIAREGHAHYMVCLRCGQMINLPECPLRNLKEIIENDTGFEITGHSIELFGYCKQCRKDFFNHEKM